MKDGLYQFLVGVLDLFLWCGELIGEENLPRRGPAVFIANHLDATGPIATACSIPMRVHPWVIADMMDKGLAPLWLQADFVERQLHFKPPVSRWVARALCRISVPFFLFSRLHSGLPRRLRADARDPGDKYGCPAGRKVRTGLPGG